MRTKYDQDDFAVYKGITFYTYYTCSGYIGLLTEDEKLAKKFDFLQDDDSYYKEVSPYEVTEYYEQRFKAKYKGKRVGIMEGDDIKVNIQPNPEDFTYEDLIKFGFKQVEKGVYEKKIEIDIQIIYDSDRSTKRPLVFFVEYKIDGIEQSPIYHYN